MHHAWEPICEIDTPRALANPSVAELVNSGDFGSFEETPLPSVAGPLTRSNNEVNEANEANESNEVIVQTPNATVKKESKENLISSNIKALKVNSKDPLPVLAEKLLKHFQKENDKSSIVKITSFSPMISGSLVDPRNIYNICALKTDPPIDPKKSEGHPRVSVIAAKLLRPNNGSQTVIIIFEEAQLPQEEDGKVLGTNIRNKSQELLEKLNKVDSLSIEF